MRSGRPIAVCLLAALFFLGAAGRALAGGSWLAPDRDLLTSGDRVTARGSFSLQGSLEGRITDGPYFAYLVPAGEWIRPGYVPADAVLLGQLIITRGRAYGAVARTTFTVPAVRRGAYSVGYCNFPCTVDGIGDLMGGMVWIGDTRAEARLVQRVYWLRLRLEGARYHGHRVAELAEGLEAEVARLEADVASGEAVRRELSDRVSGLQTRLRAAEQRARPTLIPAWAVVLAAIALLALAGAIVVRRRGPAAAHAGPEDARAEDVLRVLEDSLRR
ncbi:MAG: hypothetical protein HYU54_07625 [Actinobacteria bacterium]|nr:hypothetical protein [Actinomycetota bacterium]